MGFQASFLKDVKSLVKTMEEMGNPFVDTSNDLLVLDTRVIVDKEVAESYTNIQQLGKCKSSVFFQERLVTYSTPIGDTLSKNCFIFKEHQKGSVKIPKAD